MVENKGDETIFCEDNDVLQYTFTIIEFIQISLLTVTLLYYSFVCWFKTKYLFLMFQFIIFYIGQNINSLIKKFSPMYSCSIDFNRQKTRSDNEMNI